MPEVKVRILKTAGGWDATIMVPTLPGAPGPIFAATAKAQPSGEVAVKKAAAGALKVLDNPAVQAMLPPQAAIAINVLKKVPFKKAAKFAKKLKFW
jgi:hypothetical protein